MKGNQRRCFRHSLITGPRSIQKGWGRRIPRKRRGFVSLTGINHSNKVGGTKKIQRIAEEMKHGEFPRETQIKKSQGRW